LGHSRKNKHEAEIYSFLRPFGLTLCHKVFYYPKNQTMLTPKRVLAFASGLSLLFVAPVLAGVATSASNGITVIAKTASTTAEPAAKPATRMAPSTTKISINKASALDLQKVKGIGPVTADLIIKNRPYKSMDDLVKKKVLSSKQLQSMKSTLSL
jgi:competence protein ComEA